MKAVIEPYFPNIRLYDVRDEKAIGYEDEFVISKKLYSRWLKVMKELEEVNNELEKIYYKDYP